MDQIDLAQKRDRWWALINGVMKPLGSIKWREFAENHLASVEVLCSMEYILSWNRVHICIFVLCMRKCYH